MVCLQVLVFIVFLVFRCGNKGDQLTWTANVNSVVFGIMVYAGESTSKVVFKRDSQTS
jgi:hypothetical protein